MRRLLLIVLLVATGAAGAADATAGVEKEGRQPAPLLDCKRLSWVKNCEDIDDIARKNPDAPLRLLTPDGIELNFVPGTPTAMIYHQINPSRETAKALYEYNAKYLDHMEKAAKVMRDYMTDIGVMPLAMAKNIDAIEGGKPKSADVIPGIVAKTAGKAIKPSNIRVWMFYDSKCGPCRQTIPEIYQFSKNNPAVDITLLQMDGDLDYVMSIRNDFGLKAGPIPEKDRATLLPKIAQTPTFWVQDNRSKKTTVIEGYMNAETLRIRLTELSQ